jgi:hypothetical protein
MAQGKYGFIQENLNIITMLWISYFFSYNDPLFIGGWIDISQLVSNVNGEAFGGTSHPFSDPKTKF